MIIRLMGEGQFVVPDDLLSDLNRVDNELVSLLEEGDEDTFRKRLADMHAMVREMGTPLSPEELVASNFVIPPDDVSIAEAKR
ncbi:MAG: PspA-associated protein PspAA, partial [Methermicoccaceae archaeon]